MAGIESMGATAARALTDRIKVGVEAIWELVKQAYTERAWSALGYESWDDYCTREFGTSRLRLPREERAEVVASLRESGLSIRAIAAATGHGVATVKRELDAGVPSGTPEPQSITGTDGKTYTPKPRYESDVEHRDGTVEHTVDDRQFEEMTEDEVVDAILDEDAARYAVANSCVSCSAVHPEAEMYPVTDGFECQECADAAPESNEPAAEPDPQPERVARRAPLPETFWKASLDTRRAQERLTRLVADDRFGKNKDQIADANLHDLVRARDALTDVINQLQGA